MEDRNSLTICRTDFDKLSDLVQLSRSPVAELLDEELARATVVPDNELPKDVVSMNSTATFRDKDSGSELVVTLVYPEEAESKENKISILAPVGAALIGLRVGQSIDWPLPSGAIRRLEVLSVSQRDQ